MINRRGLNPNLRTKKYIFNLYILINVTHALIILISKDSLITHSQKRCMHIGDFYLSI